MGRHRQYCLYSQYLSFILQDVKPLRTFYTKEYVYGEEDSHVSKEDENAIKIVPIVHIEVGFSVNPYLNQFFDGVEDQVQEEETLKHEHYQVHCRHVSKQLQGFEVSCCDYASWNNYRF